MARSIFKTYWRGLVFSLLPVLVLGCVSSRDSDLRHRTAGLNSGIERGGIQSPRMLATVAYQAPVTEPEVGESSSSRLLQAPAQLAQELLQRPTPDSAPESLSSLVSFALAQNPRLLRLAQEAAAAEARANYADALPDPTLAANLFAYPIETAAGSQRANLSVKQMIPWLSRLDAQSQQAIFEALALGQVQQAERLKVAGDVRALYFRLYVLGKQIETNQASREILLPMIEVANSRVATGQLAARGDVLLGTLELSKLREQVVTLRQQLASTKAQMNRMLGRQADYPLGAPRSLEAELPDWDHAMLRQVAWRRQPEVAAAELRTQATHWGLEVARLKSRPEFSVGASWFAIDDNRPTPSLVDVGQDAWSIGASMSLPIWRRKYAAIEDEAAWRHSASHATVQDVRQRYDALLLELWERAKAAAETAELYRETLLPQARQTLDADQQSYSNGSIGFERLVRDFRNVLMLELGYHRSLGELATTLARIQQAVGADLSSTTAQPDSLGGRGQQ